MFERFTGKARHVVVLAQEEARQLQHNYIGTEHILLGLLRETGGVAFRVLDGIGMTLEGTRRDTVAIVGTGKARLSGHIPFTPRAKKTLELALREALQLQHHYIGTEHVLLGVIREGDGVGAQLLKQHGELSAIREAVLDLLPSVSQEGSTARRWLRRRAITASGEAGTLDEAVLSATPAADATLSEAARLAGSQAVGSHHLLLATLADPDTAASRALAALGVDLDKARQALRGVDVTGTTDEPPEEAGRRQMTIRVASGKLTLEATDPVIVAAGGAALEALADTADPAGTIRGDLPVCASLRSVWSALEESLGSIRRRAASAAEPPAGPEHPGPADQGRPDQGGSDQGGPGGAAADHPDGPENPGSPGTEAA